MHRNVTEGPSRAGVMNRAIAIWRRPVVWVGVWLVYSLTMLGYLAYESARNGVFCLSAGA